MHAIHSSSPYSLSALCPTTWLARLFLGIVAFALAFATYSYTLCPGLPPGYDSAELITAAATAGIAHPPGYPLYTMLCYLATLLIPGAPALSCNLFSAFTGALAVGFIAVAFYIIADSASLALLAALAFAFARTPWRMSVGAEVFSLHLALTAALILLALLWREADVPHRRRLLYLVALTLGLALSHHHTIVLLLPGLGLYFWLARDKKDLGFAWPQLLCLVAGLLPYLYLPIRAAQKPPVNWGNPNTLERFLWVVTRQGYGGAKLSTASESIAAWGYHLGHWAQSLSWNQFPVIGTILGLTGGYYTWRERHPEGILFASLFLFSGPIFTLISSQPAAEGYIDMLERFYAASDLGFAGLIVIGLSFLLRYDPAARLSRTLTPSRARLATIIALAASLPLLGLLRNAACTSERGQFLTDDSLRVMTQSIPPGALVITCSDLSAGMFMYATNLQNLNVIHLPFGLLASPWFQAQMPPMMYEAYRAGGISRLLTVARMTGLAVYTDYPIQGVEGDFVPEGLMYRYRSADDPEQDIVSLALKSLVLLNTIDREQRGTYTVSPDRPFWANYLVTRWRESYQVLVKPLEGYCPEAAVTAQKKANQIANP